jgi:hypothetical protein
VPQAFANTAASTTDGALTDPISTSSLSTGRANARIRVYALYAQAGGTATNITFNSKGAGAGTAIGPLMAAGANGGAVLPYNPKGWFTTKPGEGLTVTTGAGSTSGLQVVYDYIPL